MDINDLTLRQIKEISALINNNTEQSSGINSMLGAKVIVRTFSAGVWFGTLFQKDGKEVILTNSRRMWRWLAVESISLSAVAIHGISHNKSKIVEPVDSVWMEAIEIIPCTDKAIFSIEGAPNVKAE